VKIRVGVISDTHGHLNPKVFDLFADVGRILHAGDVNTMDMIIELSAIAPVIAVHGNMDVHEVASRYPEDVRVQLAGNDVFMTHNGGMLLRSPSIFKARCGPKRPDIFVWGHTHRSENKVIDGMLSLNPGSAGRPRLGLPSSVAILVLESGRPPRAEIEILET
jgi:putative phosphoesterase